MVTACADAGGADSKSNRQKTGISPEAFMSFSGGLKTIIVATDLSGSSEAALEYARKLAAAYGARIVMAHGIDPVEYADVDTVPVQVLTGLTEEARAVLDKLSGDLLREGIHSHSEIRQGAVAQMLLDVARQYEAGLIVIGTKGMEGAGPVIVGAIAEQLVRLAPCPVLAVAGTGMRARFGPSRAGRCCWPWSATRLPPPRWPSPARWRRPSGVPCWCCMRARRPRPLRIRTPAPPRWRSLASSRKEISRCAASSKTAIRQTPS